MPREMILDHLKLLWCGVETTFGQGALPIGTDALDFLSIDASPVARRVIPNAEQVGTRGSKAPGRGAIDPMAITLETYLRGSGVASTPPRFGPLLKSAGFAETVGASVVYSRALSPAASAWVYVATADGSEGRMYGGVTMKPSIPDVGQDYARIRFQGNASHASTVYKTVVGTGGLAIGATSLPLEKGHGWVFGGAPIYVQISDGTNVEVVKVTAVAGDTATIVRAQASTTARAFTAAHVITAYVPPRTAVATTPIGETLGSFTLTDGAGAQSVREVTKLTIDIASGVDHLEKEAFAENRGGLVPMRYGEQGVQVTADLIYAAGSTGVAFLHAQRNAGTQTTLSIAIGSATGNKFVVALPTAQVTDLNAPDGADGPRRGTAIFTGYAADGADVSITCS